MSKNQAEIGGTVAALAGIGLLGIAYLLGRITVSGQTVAHINGVCTSALGSLLQMSPRVAASCGWVALYEQVHGWMIVAGVLLILAGAAAGIYVGHLNSQQTARSAA